MLTITPAQETRLVEIIDMAKADKPVDTNLYVYAILQALQLRLPDPNEQPPKMTSAQGIALARRVNDTVGHLTLAIGPFDLPDGYVMATIHDKRTGVAPFACGIAPNGDVSS